MKTDIQCRGQFRDLSALSETPPPWTHVASLGEFPGTVEIPAGYNVPGYGVVKEGMSVEGLTVFNRAVFDKLASTFKPDVLIDADHLSHDATQTTEALGWGTELRFAKNGDDLEMKTPWTPPGREKIEMQVYRYISPEFTGDVRFENDVFKFYPGKLVGAGLTNRPKLTVLRPVSVNRANPGAARPKLVSLLCRLIDIPEASEDHEIEAKANAFQADLATVKNRAAKASELENEILTFRQQEIERDLETYSDVIGDKDVARELLQMNREVTLRHFAAQQARQVVKATAPAPLYQKNRATAPDARKFFEPDTGEAKSLQQRSIVTAIQRREKCNFSEAWNIAKTENPDLF